MLLSQGLSEWIESNGVAILSSNSAVALASAPPRNKRRRSTSPDAGATMDSSPPLYSSSESARVYSALPPSSYGAHGGLHPDSVEAQVEPPCAQCGLNGPQTLLTCPCCARDACSQECLSLHERQCWTRHFAEAFGPAALTDPLPLSRGARSALRRREEGAESSPDGPRTAGL